ncbi:TetR/AcrR family transcriptional regulator [Hyalangium versicolor]|uniref:TetR/AcrR family transcriptional regulator n=1 Tax=Hyalangium versicolor TaxID=2861190 RepID=UPI001CCF4565|nr:TetR/AcrR family transcriptional regulator [Hyalangium versicolor]
MDEGDRPRAGRKRSEHSRTAVLEAALRLLREQGYAALSIEAIAREAGVGKQTIYRWWTTKGSVVLEALAEQAEEDIPIEDHGSLQRDVESFMAVTFERATPETSAVLKALMAEAQLDPDFGMELRTSLIDRRRASFRSVLLRARERGDLPADANVDLLTDVVYGVMWYRLLIGHAPLDRKLASELAGLIKAASS